MVQVAHAELDEGHVIGLSDIKRRQHIFRHRRTLQCKPTAPSAMHAEEVFKRHKTCDNQSACYLRFPAPYPCKPTIVVVPTMVVVHKDKAFGATSSGDIQKSTVLTRR